MISIFTASKSNESTWSALLIAVASALLLFVLFRSAWLCDDAYINFRVIDNFWNGYGLRWNIDERVQVYTSPLWLLILLILSPLFTSVYWLGIVTSLVLSISAVYITAKKYLNFSIYQSIIFLFALSVSSFFIDFATSGLEQPIAYLLFGLFLAELSNETISEKKLGILSGLLILTRMDYLLIVLPSLVFHFFSLRDKKQQLNLIISLIFFPLLWALFGLFYYGFALPNTFFAKIASTASLHDKLSQSFVYFSTSILASPIIFILWITSCFLGMSLKKEKYIIVGIFIYILYIASVGGDYMVGRFLAAPTFLLIAILTKKLPKETNSFTCLTVGILLLCGQSLNARSLFLEPQSDRNVPVSGIIDEKFFDYQMSGLMLWSTTTSHEFHYNSKVGTSYQNQPVKVDGAIGRVGYFAGPRCHIIDPMGIGDAFLSRLEPASKDARVGHLRRDIPNKYFESVFYKKNLLENPTEHALLNDIFIITRAPLLSWERWMAIARVQLALVKN
jgi:arabinofuranosyltransferase